MHRPKWFKNDQVLFVNAKTCGINKDGFEQYVVNRASGQRTHEVDNQLGKLTDEVLSGTINGKQVAYMDASIVWSDNAVVPSYYDVSSKRALAAFVGGRSEDFTVRSLGQLIDEDYITVRHGHGSPSADQRVGDIPYIKVSDLRAGSVNVNPTNMIPEQLARSYWKAESSGLRAFDLVSPERASKNIGEFCVLMPGQERVVLTKEVLIVRSTSAYLSQFFLLWALSLEVVRKQWDRIVFMQTNREDVGDRFMEIEIPFPKTKKTADNMARPLKEYF